MSAMLKVSCLRIREDLHDTNERLLLEIENFYSSCMSLDCRSTPCRSVDNMSRLRFFRHIGIL